MLETHWKEKHKHAQKKGADKKGKKKKKKKENMEYGKCSIFENHTRVFRWMDARMNKKK